MPIYFLSPSTILVVEVNIKLKNMIDDKKIAEAAINKCGFNSFKFYRGAKWMQKELLKNLWHPAKEIPEEERPVLVAYKHGGYSIEYWKAYNISGQVNYWTLDITQWLYVDELFPNEGGEQ